MVSTAGNEKELLARVVHEVVGELVKAQKEGQDVNLNRLKCQIAQKHGVTSQPKLIDIIAAVPNDYKELLVPKLKAKPVRTASGIAVVAVMSMPHRCPHINYTGNICIYCPGGPDSDFEYSSQSYTGYEPTSMRAIRARYDPWLQTRGRVKQLKDLGHSIDKVEFIIMGGTFMSLSKEYREHFIRGLHDALIGYRSVGLKDCINNAETSAVKCIGITIETRPDYCLPRHLDDMLSYGCTRLEIGVQSTYEDVARDTNRGHTVASVCETFHMSKDTGYKVVIHMMPDLPNVGIERDVEQFIELFENPQFRPDGLKIYPTLVIRGTGLYELWQTGRYKSYPLQVLVDLIAHIMSLVPPWTRVYRVQRDIPMPLVTSGVEYGNLREHALARMKQLGLACRDVRTREVGIQEIHEKVKPDQVELIRRDYYANGGWETFISFEDAQQDVLIGLLRLRKCSDMVHRPELKKCASVVRELHVYGTAIPVSARDPTKFQHQGFGRLLMEEAERIAREEHGSKKLAVISGVGTRQYYRKLGYELDGPYMTKMLIGLLPLFLSSHGKSKSSPSRLMPTSMSPRAASGSTPQRIGTGAPFDCSHQLDPNTMLALRHDDDEDRCFNGNLRTHSVYFQEKQKHRQEQLKKFKPGEPCVVCGDTASGIHYNACVCNGCKTFFRRVIIENRTYSCKRDGDCPIDRDMRCSCRHCRFKKCLKVGMDCVELNLERSCKRRAVERPHTHTISDDVKDPLIISLIEKEKKFLMLLTSTITPIYSNLAEALGSPHVFTSLSKYESSQMSTKDSYNFSYWRSKILSIIIEWAKSFEKFNMLTRVDQEVLIVHMSFSNLVLSEAYHTSQRYSDRIVFPDGLSGFRNLNTNMIKEKSGLIPTVVAVINNILVPIRKMRMTEIEYVLLQAIILFDPECLSLSPQGQAIVTETRQELLSSLRGHLNASMSKYEAAYRFAAILLRISACHKVAAFKRETLCTIEMFNLMSPHPLTMEISKKYPEVSFF